jgi:hypothetical protein
MADQTKEALGFIARLLGGAGMRSMPLQTVQTVVKGGAFVPTPNKNPIRGEQVSSIDIARALADDQLQPMDFDAGVVFVPNNPQNNAGFIDTPENRNAFIHQTPEEHEQALRSFLDKKNIPPEKAVQLGIKAEEALDKWWNDKEPRRPVTPTSSAVKSARIGPNGDIYIKFASGNKEYQYRGNPDPVKASEALAELVARPASIGKRINSWSGDWGKAHTYLPK